MLRESKRYENISKDIIDIYLDYNIKGFPLDEIDICNKLGVSLVPYSSYVESKEGIDLLVKQSEYSFFVKASSETSPTIYFNDFIASAEVKRFSIFHELKHYIYNEDSRYEDEDDLAEFFARYFLCPIPYLIMKGIDSENEIISHFGVTYTVACNVISNIRSRKQWHGCSIFDHEIPLLKQLDKDAYDVFSSIIEGGDVF